MFSRNIYFFEPISADDKRIKFDETDNLLIKSANIRAGRRTKEKLCADDIFNGEYDGHLGYHLTNNILLECLYRAKLTQNEFKIFLYIIRWTAGFHQRLCHRNITRISKETGVSRNKIYHALKGLKEKNMVHDYLRHDSHKCLLLNWRPWKWVNVGSLVHETVSKIIEKHKDIIEQEERAKVEFQHELAKL